MTPLPIIAMVTDDYIPAVTGVGVHVQKVSQELVRRGHRVVVVTSRRRRQPVFEEVDGVRIHRVRCVSIQGFAQALPLPSELKKIFQDEKIGIVHFQYISLMMIAGIRAARSLRLPTIYTAHMTADLLVQPLFMRPLRGPLTRLCFDLLERVDHVLCPSMVQARQVSQYTIRPRVHRVLNPIEFASGTAAVAHAGDRFTVLFVGRLGLEKNVGYLLKAFQLFARDHPQAEVKIAGQGVMEEEWRQLAKDLGVADRVHFLGPVPHEDLPRLYAACQVFFLPSVKEVLALVALEAMRCARPVIVTDRIACGPELVEDGESGWIVSADRPEEAAERLSRLAADPALGARMGLRGLERSRGYTLPVVGEQLEKIYAVALGAAPSAETNLETEVRSEHQTVCVFCGKGRLGNGVESEVLPTVVRNAPSEFARMWRCPECLSLHALAHVPKEEFEKRSPFKRRRLNPFNRRMFVSFYKFLVCHGVRPEQSVLLYGLNAELLKRVFEGRGQSPIDVVERPLPPESLVTPPARTYDVVVVVEYLECAEDPRHVLTFAAQHLKPGGLLVIHTPNAHRIKLSPRESQRLYQPHRIHIAAASVLVRMAERSGFRLHGLFHRNYMDTLWPFVHYRAFHEFAHWGGGTLSAAVEFRLAHLRRTWWRLPWLMGFGFFGGFWWDRCNMVAIFSKSRDPAA